MLGTQRPKQNREHISEESLQRTHTHREEMRGKKLKRQALGDEKLGIRGIEIFYWASNLAGLVLGWVGLGIF